MVNTAGDPDVDLTNSKNGTDQASTKTFTYSSKF